MDQLLRLFDLFNQTAKNIAVYLPQSGSDLVNLFKKLLELGLNLDIWMGNTLGVSIGTFVSAIAKIAIISGTFLLDLIKQVVARL